MNTRDKYLAHVLDETCRVLGEHTYRVATRGSGLPIRVYCDGCKGVQDATIEVLVGSTKEETSHLIDVELTCSLGHTAICAQVNYTDAPSRRLGE